MSNWQAELILAVERRPKSILFILVLLVILSGMAFAYLGSTNTRSTHLECDPGYILVNGTAGTVVCVPGKYPNRILDDPR